MHQAKEDFIASVIEKPLNHMGYDLVRITLLGKVRLKLLIMIDRLDEQALTMDDCVKASRYISSLLDVEDPIEGAYDLEVSSPGLDRPLTRLKDYKRFISRVIKVRTHEPINEQKRFKGLLSNVTESGITLVSEDNETPVEIKFENIQKAHLIPIFDEFGQKDMRTKK